MDTSLLHFLSHLKQLNVRVTAEQDRLSISAPKGVLTPELVGEIKARKVDLLRFLQSPDQALPPIERISRDGYLPASSAQQRLWLSEQVTAGFGSHNVPLGLRLTGSLDRSALQTALQVLGRRQEILRTGIAQVDGAVQTFVVDRVPEVEFVSLRQAPPAKRETELLRIAARRLDQPFDLAAPPLWRACLVELDSTEHVLLLEFHRLCADTRSLQIFREEWHQCYAASRLGAAPKLPDLPVAYADYAAWYGKHVENPPEQVHYWRGQLAGPLPVVNLPVDHPRPASMTPRRARLLHRLPADLLEHILRFSSAEKTTPSVLLCTSLIALLSRYTGQNDLVLALATSGRRTPDVDKLMGPFSNVLMVRADLSDDPAVRTLLGRMHDGSSAAMANDAVSLDHVADLLQPGFDRQRLPQVMFSFDGTRSAPFELPDLHSDFFDSPSGSSPYDLTLHAEQRSAELVLTWEFNSELFEGATIQRMQESYHQTLDSFLAHPERRISECQLLSITEQQELLKLAGSIDTPFPSVCIHEAFEDQTARTPTATAVESDGHSLSYRDLNILANRLAHRFREAGLQRGAVVAVCIERSNELAAALLAVLKCGGTYLPIDLAHPRERVALMLDDSQASIVVTNSNLREAIPATIATVFSVEELLAAPTHGGDEENPPDLARPDDIAYVIYTSGTTGKPKGVEIRHRSVMNFLTAMRDAPGLRPDDVLLSVTTLSFDIFGLEMWLPLTTGAKVVIASKQDAMDGLRISRLLREQSVTVMQATPSTWRLLLDSGWQGKPDLKILCGGEAWSKELADRLLPRCSSLWNMYGPTETTIWSAIFRVQKDQPVLIGRPIANTLLYVVDSHLQPLPFGVPGELLIGGDGLARGYLNHPELTAEKFIPNPFHSGSSVYRTGDLMRYRADGHLEFLGRMDHQVKIRGFRIELGEIETLLRRHSDVREVVVAARDDTRGEKRLVAYIVAHSQEPPATLLRDYLKQYVPDYMAPSAFVFLKRLPLTTNGKVDRKSLPEPPSTAATSAPYAPPRTNTEQQIAEIWQSLLRHSRVGVNDNFFDLGGHSLLVVQLQNRFRQHFHQDVSLIELFQRPTVTTQAALLSTSIRGGER